MQTDFPSRSVPHGGPHAWSGRQPPGCTPPPVPSAERSASRAWSCLPHLSDGPRPLPVGSLVRAPGWAAGSSKSFGHPRFGPAGEQTVRGAQASPPAPPCWAGTQGPLDGGTARRREGQRSCPSCRLARVGGGVAGRDPPGRMGSQVWLSHHCPASEAEAAPGQRGLATGSACQGQRSPRHRLKP